MDYIGANNHSFRTLVKSSGDFVCVHVCMYVCMQLGLAWKNQRRTYNNFYLQKSKRQKRDVMPSQKFQNVFVHKSAWPMYLVIYQFPIVCWIRMRFAAVSTSYTVCHCVTSIVIILCATFSSWLVNVAAAPTSLCNTMSHKASYFRCRNWPQHFLQYRD